MELYAERSYEEPPAEAYCRGEHRLARSGSFEPSSEGERREAEEDDCGAEDPADRRELPVCGRRLVDAHERGQRQVEDAERVRLAYREVNGEGGGRNSPPAVARRGDRMLAIEEHGMRTYAVRKERANEPSPAGPVRTDPAACTVVAHPDRDARHRHAD